MMKNIKDTFLPQYLHLMRNIVTLTSKDHCNE